MKRERNRRECDDVTRVMGELARVTHSNQSSTDPILEQLKQCPEAFKVGEVLGKALDSFKYGQEDTVEDRFLPPAGVVVPPLA